MKTSSPMLKATQQYWSRRKWVSVCFVCVQWNPSNADTNGVEESVLNKEVSL